MFDFDVVTGPDVAEILRRRAEAAAMKRKAAALARGVAGPLSSEPQDDGGRAK